MWQLTLNGPGYLETCCDLPDGPTNLGRADDNDIVLSGDLVSRWHVRFSLRDGEISVEDLGSRNGTRLNGQPLKGPTVVREGDIVNVGENTLAIRQLAAADSDTTDPVDVVAGLERAVLEGLRALQASEPRKSDPTRMPFDEP